MNDKILINPKTNQEYRDVPPTVAAEYLGVALNYVYEGLKNKPCLSVQPYRATKGVGATTYRLTGSRPMQAVQIYPY